MESDCTCENWEVAKCDNNNTPDPTELEGHTWRKVDVLTSLKDPHETHWTRREENLSVLSKVCSPSDVTTVNVRKPNSEYRNNTINLVGWWARGPTGAEVTV